MYEAILKIIFERYDLFAKHLINGSGPYPITEPYIILKFSTDLAHGMFDYNGYCIHTRLRYTKEMFDNM